MNIAIICSDAEESQEFYVVRREAVRGEHSKQSSDRYLSKTYYQGCQQSILHCQFQCDISDVTYHTVTDWTLDWNLRL